MLKNNLTRNSWAVKTIYKSGVTLEVQIDAVSLKVPQTEVPTLTLGRERMRSPRAWSLPFSVAADGKMQEKKERTFTT